MDELETMNRPEAQEGGGSITLFLSLYLLVLAFFILLVSISTVEKLKSQAVMDGLSSAFATIFPPTSRLTNFSSSDGDVIAGQEFQTQVGAVFATVAQVIKVETVQPGRLTRVVLATDDEEYAQSVAVSWVPLPWTLTQPGSGVLGAVRYVAETYTADLYVTLPAIAPALVGRHIDAGIDLVVGARLDSAQSVTNVGWDHAALYKPNGAVYVTRGETLRAGALAGPRHGLWVMAREESINLDTPFDVAIAQAVLR